MKVGELINKLKDYNTDCEIDIDIVDGKNIILIYKADFYGTTESFEVY
jgi:hypothetical protein